MIEYARYIDEHTIDTTIPTSAVIDGRPVVGEFTPEQLKKLNYLPLVYDDKPFGDDWELIYELTPDAILVHYISGDIIEDVFPSSVDEKVEGEFPSSIDYKIEINKEN